MKHIFRHLALHCLAFYQGCINGFNIALPRIFGSRFNVRRILFVTISSELSHFPSSKRYQIYVLYICIIYKELTSDAVYKLILQFALILLPVETLFIKAAARISDFLPTACLLFPNKRLYILIYLEKVLFLREEVCITHKITKHLMSTAIQLRAYIFYVANHF